MMNRFIVMQFESTALLCIGKDGCDHADQRAAAKQEPAPSKGALMLLPEDMPKQTSARTNSKQRN